MDLPTTYKYQPLEHTRAIRLLQVRSHGQGQELNGTIHLCMLDSATSFRALSYAWSKLDKTHTLKTPDGIIRITQSLAEALDRLSTECDGGTMMLWIDALCINQEDMAEKGHQVGLMSEIYAGASSVVVWLGKAKLEPSSQWEWSWSQKRSLGSDSSPVFHALEQLADIGTMPRTEHITTKDLSAQQLFSLSKDFDTDQSTWLAFFGVLQRSWFSRIWVVQEFVVASDIWFYCGAKKIHWKIISIALRLIHEASDFWPTALALPMDRNFAEERFVVQRANALMNLRKSYGRGTRLHLFDLVNDFSRVRASSDKRDHLFAILGLSAESTHQELRPDYSESYDIVAQRYTSYFIRKGRGIDVLHSCKALPHGYPSWMPNWTENASRSHDLRFDDNPINHAGTEISSNMIYDPGLGALIIRGCWFERVFQVISFHGCDRSVSKLCQRVSAAYALQGVRQYPALQGTTVATRNVIKQYGSIPVSDTWGLSDEIVNLLIWLVCDQHESDLDSIKHHVMVDRNVCVTTSGFIGLVPNSSGPYLSIFIPFGSKVPFLLREGTWRKPGCFSIHGQCYIHGLMDGEMMSSDNFNNTEIRLI